MRSAALSCLELQGHLPALSCNLTVFFCSDYYGIGEGASAIAVYGSYSEGVFCVGGKCGGSEGRIHERAIDDSSFG